jgi:hypothetical protein
VGRIDGNGGYPCVKHAGNCHPGNLHVLLILDAVVIRMDGHRNSNTQLIADGVHVESNIPVVHGTVAAFGLGDFNNNGRIGSLGSLENTSDDKGASAVCRHGNGISLGQHGTVDDLAADEKCLRVGKQFYNILWPTDLNSPEEIILDGRCLHTHIRTSYWIIFKPGLSCHQMAKAPETAASPAMPRHRT